MSLFYRIYTKPIIPEEKYSTVDQAKEKLDKDFAKILFDVITEKRNDEKRIFGQEKLDRDYYLSKYGIYRKKLDEKKLKPDFAKLSDEELINYFNKLPDETEIREKLTKIKNCLREKLISSTNQYSKSFAELLSDFRNIVEVLGEHKKLDEKFADEMMIKYNKYI